MVNRLNAGKSFLLRRILIHLGSMVLGSWVQAESLSKRNFIRKQINIVENQAINKGFILRTTIVCFLRVYLLLLKLRIYFYKYANVFCTDNIVAWLLSPPLG